MKKQIIVSGLGELANQVPVADGAGGFSWQAAPAGSPGPPGPTGPAGSSGGASVLAYASTYNIGPTFTAAANATALRALIGSGGVLANGGTLMCDWVGTALFDTTSTVLTPFAANLNVRGLGLATVMKMGGSAENTTSPSLPLWNVTGTNGIYISDMTLQGTDALGVGGVTALILHSGTAGRVRARDVYFLHGTYAVELNGTATSVSAELDNCLIEGYGTGAHQYNCWGVGAFEASPVAWTPAKRVAIRNCRFLKFGDPAGGSLAHAIYVYQTWGLHVEGCVFHTPATTSVGFCIQHFGGSGAANVFAHESTVLDCTFGSDLANQMGIYTDGTWPTKINNCEFLNSAGSGDDVRPPFDCQIVNCTFSHKGGQNISTQASCELLIANCSFTGVLGGGCASVFVNNSGAIAELVNCRFVGATGGNGNYLWVNDLGEIRAKGCRFEGTPNNAVYGSAAGKISLTGNKFALAGGTLIANATTALAQLRIHDNDFADSAGTFFGLGVTPTVLDIQNNIGFYTKSGGVFTSTPGAVSSVAISHGLGNSSLAITPVKLSVQPANVNSRGAPTYFVTASTSAVTINLASALTSGVSYSWNWYAEYQVGAYPY